MSRSADCSVEGCAAMHYGRGYCQKHYTRWRRNGDPLVVVNLRHQGTANERFWAKVKKTESCWNWIAGKTTAGYGSFAATRRKTDYAHRIAYRELVGAIPDGLELDHLCRNRACVNPAHLEPVTPYENKRRAHVRKAASA